MTIGPNDLRLVRALAEQRFETARGMRISVKRRPSARGAPPETSGRHGRVAFPRPAPGAAGQN